MRRHAFLPALFLSACTSSYQTTRLDPSGNFTGLKPDQVVGVPFTLTKPEFTIKKIDGSDPERFQVTVNYVPDPSQRYALRLDPTWLSKIDFNMALGPGGGLTSTSADVKDQIIPFTASAVQLAASLAKMAAAMSLGEPKGMKDCLNSPGPGALAGCAILNTPSDFCNPDVGAVIIGRITQAVKSEKEDKGGALDTLFARTDDEEKCFTKGAELLGNEVKTVAMGVAESFKKEAPVAGMPAWDEDSIKTNPFSRLGFEAWKLLKNAAEKRDVSKVRKLVFATEAAAEGQSKYLKELLELEAAPTAEQATTLYAALKAIKPATPPKPAEQAGDEEVASDSAGQAKRVLAIETMLQAATGDRVQKALAGVATMTAGQWRARFIPVLQQEMADAERSALKASSPAVAAGFRRTAAERRAKLAELVNMAPDLARLAKLEAILDAVPTFDARDRHSRIAEYQGYAKQAGDIRAEMATRLAAAVATEKAAKKEAVLPVSLPWVSRTCIKDSAKAGWIYTAGAEAAEYVIVIRSANGDIEPPPLPKASETDIPKPECGA